MNNKPLTVGYGQNTSSNSWLNPLFQILSLIFLLYLFVLSVTLLGGSFKLMGKGLAESIFDVTSHPVVGLFIGIFATSLIQSSSTTTSIVVGLVGAGTLTFENAVPIIMGANIGTSVTNTIVSLAHVSRGDEFKRAFAGATVHDFFNICTVAVLLPLQMNFGIISESAIFAEHLFGGIGGAEFSSPLAAITKPVAKLIMHGVGNSGLVSLLISLAFLFLALRYLVKVLKSMVLDKVERFFQRYIFRAPILGLLLGIVLTVLVQSSSISTSLVIPLIGAGVVTLSQIYPYMLGANIGTTVTAFLASLATGSHEAVAVAFAHFLFNVYGTVIFWPLKKIPITLARGLANLTQKSRWYAFAYILITFFVVPGIIILILK